MAKRMAEDNCSFRRSDMVRRQYRRLYEADSRCQQIILQVPGAEGYRDEDLPRPLAKLLGRYDCNTMFNVLKACLMRLCIESIVPQPERDASAADGINKEPGP